MVTLDRQIRVVIGDSHTAPRELLATGLARDGGYDVAGQAQTGLELVRLASLIRPQLIVMELLLPELCGIEVLERLKKLAPRPRILIFTATTDKALIVKALRYRPEGFVGKWESLSTFRQAVDAVAAGCSFYTPAASALLYESMERSDSSPGLSVREREILQMVAESHSSKDISRRLNIAVKTVENHRAHLMQKLHIHDVAGLTRYAIRERIVSVE